MAKEHIFKMLSHEVQKAKVTSAAPKASAKRKKETTGEELEEADPVPKAKAAPAAPKAAPKTRHTKKAKQT